MLKLAYVGLVITVLMFVTFISIRLLLSPMGEGALVRVYNDVGSITVPCKAARGDELPPGILFISYGDKSSHLMGGDTQGCGMPDSKGLDVFLEVASGVVAGQSPGSREIAEDERAE